VQDVEVIRRSHGERFILAQQGYDGHNVLLLPRRRWWGRLVHGKERRAARGEFDDYGGEREREAGRRAAKLARANAAVALSGAAGEGLAPVRCEGWDA